jgi:hypothetical protein
MRIPEDDLPATYGQMLLLFGAVGFGVLAWILVYVGYFA